MSIGITEFGMMVAFLGFDLWISEDERKLRSNVGVTMVMGLIWVVGALIFKK